MTSPPVNATNSAGGSANVGVQAETFHGDVYYYVVRDDAPAEEKFHVGVSYLNGGVPSEALPLIERAAAEGLDTSEVRFFWLLALISGRTYRQFSPEDSNRIDHLRKSPVVYQADPWAEGVRVILRLLDSFRESAVAPGPFISAINDLGPRQREPVLRHLAVFLRGPLGDQVWELEREAAFEGRHAGQRADRVGLFFQPSPAKPRARLPAPPEVSARDWATALVATAVFAITVSDVGWQLIRHGSITGVLGYLLGCAGCYLASRNWLEFRWQARRREAHERLHKPVARANAPAGGFAARMDHRFDHYLAVRVPHGMDRTDWLAATAGTRSQLRDEIVEIYREQRVRAEQLDWLTRHEVETLARRWRTGTFYTPATEFRPARKAWVTRSAGIGASVLGGLLTAGTLLHADLVGGLIALVILAVSGYHAERAWTSIALEGRRAAADETEGARKLAERDAAYKAWTEKLSNIKPTDQEMAAWLDCDKKIMLSSALRHYGLKRSDVITYAFLETHGTSYERSRVRNGPWRYTQYKILIFLLTADGIRQVAFSLRTRDSLIGDLDRESYSYDAIASVQASAPRNDHRQEFSLHLVSGRTISFQVADPVSPLAPENSDTEGLDTATQDSSGLRNTLRVLEGVAADGKEWIARENQAPDVQ